MSAHLFALCFAANDPLRLARFWSGILGREMASGPHDGTTLVPGDETAFRIRFVSTQESETG